jgi:hypothetical protein
MKKHILYEHPTAWGRWTSVNQTLVVNDRHQEKSKQRIVVGYGIIINHFGNTIPYKKDDAGQFMEDLLFVVTTYMSIFIVEN